ncbi:MAG: hypothetical protein ACTSV3_02845 [Candidatus Thorarchaeota archaeon]|nr:MAG: hypothetical protein DRP09_02785 [Candidatus Thorarchaeota archaeon]RLI58616.1 MAG: hypothetical protein DRO87_05210 [Candidatus Thorarchaeota archaeon]
MPVVELVAKRIYSKNRETGLEIVDLIVLLWLYSNPYDSHRRQLSSMRAVLKMCETMQVPGGGLEVTEEELTQIVLGSLQKLKSRGLVYIQSAGIHYVKGTLTEKGIDLIKNSVTTPIIRKVTAEFGNNR